tara:strand:+ start:1034 stop:1417 length:384 start_codon:yes stop_codon:yes gene_type:complete
MFSTVPLELIISMVLLAVLVVMLFSYGFHGLLRFGKDLNYLVAIILAVIAGLLLVILGITAIEYIAEVDASTEQKNAMKRKMLGLGVGVVVVGVGSLIKYNFSKLYGALNKALPKNTNKVMRRKRRK